MMKKLISLALILALSGCASYNHHKIVAANKAAEREMGIPDYGVSNRNHPVEDAAHGWLWWVGTNELKKLLTK